MAEYNWNIKLTSRKGHMILIDTVANYGYWERPDGSEGGGIWFDWNSDKCAMELVDYDGTSVLPKSIVQTLREADILCDESFD